jgi:hypothetical protein
MALTFPSLGFFQALQAAMVAERERFQRLGFIDVTFAVRVLGTDGGAPAEFTLAFEVFECAHVTSGAGDGAADFVLEGTLAAWRDMLDNIHRLGAADTGHSLNTLTHFGEGLQLRYDDPDGHDKMYRFAESIQEFFDLSAGIDFAYPDGARPPARRTAERRAGA